jgi:phage tail sheath gpL-like
MPDNIVFNDIPLDIRVPGQYIEIDPSKAVSGLPGQNRRVLVLGQRISAGTVAEKIPAPITGISQAKSAFGRGSNIALMCESVLKTAPALNITAVALDDAEAGIADVRTITISGAPAKTGILKRYFGGIPVSTAVTAGETNNITASNFSAAVNANSDLPVTASASEAVLTITAKNKGVVGKLLDIRAAIYPEDRDIEGMTFTVATTEAGDGNPDIMDAISTIDNEQYVTIVAPWTDSENMTAIEAELDGRFGPLQRKTGHLFIAVSGTHAELTTYGTVRNSPHISCWGLKGSPTPDFIRAAILAAVVETAGAIDPARPFQTLELPYIIPPAEQDRFSKFPERNLLLFSGISTAYETQGGGMAVERVITMYQKNSAGIEDASFLNLNTKWTVDYIRYAVAARLALRYPRHKLADDGTKTGVGQPIVTPKLLTAELIVLFIELGEAGLVENIEQFRADLKIVRSTADKERVNAIIPPDLINGFRIFAAAIQFRS